jgi:hypothetical protein
MNQVSQDALPQQQSLPLWKKLILGGVALVAVIGLADAFSNLPVVSGCTFYGDCPADLPPEPPSER